MSNHRYWRIINVITQGSGDVLNAMEGGVLRLVNTQGVITNNPSKTISSGGYGGDFDPLGAFDDTKNFAAAPDANGDRWIGYDFGVNVNVISISVSMHTKAPSVRNWKSVDVEYSDDLINWTYAGTAYFNIVGEDKTLKNNAITSLSSISISGISNALFINIYSLDESGSFSGIVTQGESGQPKTPLKTEVLLYDRLTNRMLQRTWSSGTGVYSFNGLDTGREYYAVTLHPNRTYNAAIQDGLKSGMTA